MRHYLEIVKTFFQVAPGKKHLVAQFFASEMLNNIAALLPPIATAGIIGVLTNNDFKGIWFYVILYVAFYAFYFLSLAWNYHVYGVLHRYYYNTVQEQLFNHIAQNDSIFEKISKGKITSTCSYDVLYLVDVADAITVVLAGFIQLIIIFCIFISYNVFIAFIAAAIDIIYIVLMNNNARQTARRYEGTRKYEDKIIDILGQMLGNLRQVKALDVMPSLTKRLTRTRADWTEQYKAKRRLTITRACELPAVVYFGKILLYVLLGYMVVEGQMTIDRLILLISYFEMVISESDATLKYLLELINNSVRINRIKNILDYTTANAVDYGDLENDYINGSVVFDNVSYAVKNQTILNNVSFKAYPNEITAIVGKPGSGKTTIINLLYRLYRVKAGSILLDDESIYNYSDKVYSSNVSGVFQKSFVFKMSIRDNLSLVDSNVNHQIEACKRVGLHKTIEALPKGYNTIIDEGDGVLSDGERQKLAIARAILSKAEVLLFDEVTSNIDPASTNDVINILQDLKDDHTIIIITHKPEIMELADKVVVLKDGKVSAKGENKAVYKKSKLYQELRKANFTGPSLPDEERHAS